MMELELGRRGTRSSTCLSISPGRFSNSAVATSTWAQNFSSACGSSKGWCITSSATSAAPERSPPVQVSILYPMGLAARASIRPSCPPPSTPIQALLPGWIIRCLVRIVRLPLPLRFGFCETHPDFWARFSSPCGCEHGHGKKGGVYCTGIPNRKSGGGHTSGHLYNGKERIYSIQSSRFDGYAQKRAGGSWLRPFG